jgi:hypothetical protein
MLADGSVTADAQLPRSSVIAIRWAKKAPRIVTLQVRYTKSDSDGS